MRPITGIKRIALGTGLLCAGIVWASCKNKDSSMVLLRHGPFRVHYGQAYVESQVGPNPGLLESFRGQSNGLCGAAEPGALFLITGLHTGKVDLRVERHRQAPPLDDSWEDIVEVSFRPTTRNVALVAWAAEHAEPFAGFELIDYRVRYSGRRMDDGKNTDPQLDGEPLVDSYLLQFWPAPARPDQVVKKSSELAAYWHAQTRL